MKSAAAPRSTRSRALPLALALALSPAALAAPPQHDLDGAIEAEWQAWHDTTKSASEVAAAVELDGASLFTTGRTRRLNSSSGQWLTAGFDASGGAELWRALYPAERAHGQEAVDLALGADRVFVTGRLAESSGFTSDLGIVAYSKATGTPLWEASLTGSGTQVPAAIDAAASVVCVVGTDGQDLLVTARSSADGQDLWTKQLDGGAGDSGRDVAVSVDGTTVFVVGRSEVAGQGGGIVAAFDLATGSLLWSQQPAASMYMGELRALAQAPDGSRLFVAGELGDFDDIHCYDAGNGALLWRTAFDNTGPWYGGVKAVAPSADSSRLFVTGVASSTGGKSELRTLCLDAASGAIVWSKDWIGPAPCLLAEGGVDLAVHPSDGSVHVTGIACTGSDGSDWVTLSFDQASGFERWGRLHGGTGDDAPTAIASSATRTVVVGAQHAGQNEDDLVVQSLLAVSGLDEWSASIDLTDSAYDILADLCLSPDGALLFATGEACCGQSAELFAMDASSGSVLWSVSPSLASDARGDCVAATTLGSAVYSSGRADDAGYVAAHARSDGTELWHQAFPAAPLGGAIAVQLAVSPDETRLFTTTALGLESSGTHDYTTSAWSAVSGAPLWTQTHDGSGLFDQPVALAVSPDGTRLFVTGTSSPTNYVGTFGYLWPDLDIGTIAYDTASGTPLWTAYYHGAPGVPYEEGRDVAVSPDGGLVLVTGVAATSTSDDFITVAYDASSGSELWSTHFDGGGGGFGDLDRPAAVAVDPLGRWVLVAGSSMPFGSATELLAVVAYDLTTGVELWRQVRATTTIDRPTSLVIEPGGSRAVITGSSRTTTGEVRVLSLVLDTLTGAKLASATYSGAGMTSPALAAPALVLGTNPRRFYVGVWGSNADADADDVVLSYLVPRLSADVGSISTSTGGTQELALVTEQQHAGRPYLVLGSTTAPAYGIPIDFVELPLGYDSYLLYTLAHANQPPLIQTFGLLDASGLGEARLSLPPAIGAALAWTTLHHAYLVFDVPGPGGAILASNTTSVLLEP